MIRWVSTINSRKTITFSGFVLAHQQTSMNSSIRFYMLINRITDHA